MQNAGLDESEAEIKIAGRNISNLRYVDDTTLMQDPDSLTACPFHQEISKSFLSLSIRGQTEWKPQSQKTNQPDHMDYSLV